MESADHYLHEMRRIVGIPKGAKESTLSFSFDSLSEAKTQLGKINQLQKELKQLKKDITGTINEINSSYTGKKGDVQAGFFAFIKGKEAMGRDKAVKKENLRRKQMNAVAPYQSVISNIDNILSHLDNAKSKIKIRMGEYSKE